LATSSGKNFRATKRQLYVFRLMDHTHPAATQLLNDAVVGDGLPDHEGNARSPQSVKSIESESDLWLVSDTLSLEIRLIGVLQNNFYKSLTRG
jgi:hypothetical protein